MLHLCCVCVSLLPDTSPASSSSLVSAGVSWSVVVAHPRPDAAPSCLISGGEPLSIRVSSGCRASQGALARSLVCARSPPPEVRRGNTSLPRCLARRRRRRKQQQQQQQQQRREGENTPYSPAGQQDWSRSLSLSLSLSRSGQQQQHAVCPWREADSELHRAGCLREVSLRPRSTSTFHRAESGGAAAQRSLEAVWQPVNHR